MNNLKAIKIILLSNKLPNLITLLKKMGADVLKIETNTLNNLKDTNIDLFHQIELSDILITDKTELQYIEIANINPQLVFCQIDLDNTIFNEKQNNLIISLYTVNLILSALFSRARNGKGQLVKISSNDIETLLTNDSY